MGSKPVAVEIANRSANTSLGFDVQRPSVPVESGGQKSVFAAIESAVTW